MEELEYVTELSEEVNNKIEPKIRKQTLISIRDIVPPNFRTSNYDFDVKTKSSDLVIERFSLWQNQLNTLVEELNNRVTALENEVNSLKNRVAFLESQI